MTTAALPIHAPAPMRTSVACLAARGSAVEASSVPCVCGAARDVDAGGEQHVALEVHQPEMAARADVDVLVDARAGLGEDRRRTRSSPSGAQRASVRARNARRRYWPSEAGHQRQRLGRPFERPVAAHDVPTHENDSRERA